MNYEPGYEPQPIDLESLSPAACEWLAKNGGALLVGVPDRTIGPAAVQKALLLAATSCECCDSGCDCGCVLECPVHKGTDRTIGASEEGTR